MKTRHDYDLPGDKRALQQKAVRLEWATIFFMLTIIGVVYLTMGSSQAMKAAWVEDLLSLVPPISFLISVRVQKRDPNQRFPYGYHRVASISFLVAATALSIFGLFIFYDSVMALLMKEHPTIGLVSIFGRDVWAGWVMIAALSYSAIPPVILGRMKLPLSRELHEKTLHTDAQMNKADWMTAGAGIVGILGVGIGWWWADAVAAGIISFDILRDGFKNLKAVVEDLMDREPVTVERHKPHEMPERIRERLLALDWVADAEVRLREEGNVFAGEAYVVPRDEEGLVARLEDAARRIHALDWRVYDVVLTPVPRIDHAPERSSQGEPEGSG